MSLKLSILGWSALNLRCPDHQISLCPKNSQAPYKVTLIQMPNGTGKTTTLNLLRATLSGSAKQWTPEQIMEFRNNNNSAASGSFIVKLSLDDKLLTFELNFDFNREKASYRTTYGSAGIKDGFSPPPSIKKFLNPEFVSLFVFNGELARNLLDSRQTRARDAIDSLFQLSLLEDISSKFQQNWENHTKNTGFKTEQALKQRTNKLKDLKERKKEIEARKKELHLRKSYLNTEIQKAEQEYNIAFNKDKDLGAQLKKLQHSFTGAEKTVSQELQQTIEQMRSPEKLFADFGRSLLNLKNNLDSLKLPSSTSQEFFKELSRANKCVCNRDIDDQASKAILERASQYLGEDEVGVLNSIKSDIANYCDRNSTKLDRELKENLERLGNYIRLKDNLKTEISATEKQRFEQGDSELESKQQRLREFKHQLEACEAKLKEIERSPLSNPSDDTKCLKELENLIKKAEDDVAEATNTITLKNKTEIVRQILTQSRKQAREKLRKFVIDETNQRISQLLTRNRVILEDIQDSLQLKNRKGASEGQTLSVSYAFLATLFSQSTYQLPFIVDSPAISLDLNVRTEVAGLVPSLSEQFLAFTISSERQGFVSTLDRAANHEVKYLTLFRQTSEMEHIWQDLDTSIVTETTDGVLIEGKEFFEQFDLDDEV